MPPIPVSHSFAEQQHKMEEKEFLLPTSYDVSGGVTDNHRTKTRTTRILLASFGFVLATLSLAFVVLRGNIPGCHGRIMRPDADMAFMHFNSDVHAKVELCSQPAPLTPNVSLWSSLVEKDVGTYSSETFRTRAVNWLSGAVKVKTETYDSMQPVGTDPRWEAFGPFHDYLSHAFPLVHSALKLTKVNTYGLLYEWEGTEPSLKPLLLAAHQDVVPVNPETVDAWTHPPYSGYYDGKRVWGRGSSDDKSGLIGILTTIETLLENSFQPKRTVVLAFGFDEEASGLHGASAIGRYLLSTYGENSFAMLVDEGGDYLDEYGVAVATVGTAEKGYIDARVEVTAPGGHSSVPSAHTTIGILSALLVSIESTPYTPHLNRGTPMYAKALCLAAHAPKLPHMLRHSLRAAATGNDKALSYAEGVLFSDSDSEGKRWKALAGTTQAIDLVQGGVKANALPESAWAVVNHRIATDSSIEAVQEHIIETLRPLAGRFNLTYTAFGRVVSGGKAYGTLNVEEAWGAALKSAPVTPTEGDPYKLLAGTIRATFDAHRGVKSEEPGSGVVVSPGIMSGNTDTRHYWALTEHIFRYNHHYTGPGGWLAEGAHTIDESIAVDAWLEMIRFFTTLILNADEAEF